MARASKQSKSAQLRIIGGRWRGRLVNFQESDGLRPTGDRIRETLFNWLQMEIEGATCVDLYAGSGALGWEALSRGAAQVTFLDTHTRTVQSLQQTQRLLAAEATVLKQDALHWLRNANQGCIDIAFVDPPFAEHLLDQTLELLFPLLHENSVVYFEADRRQPTPITPSAWEITRLKQSGNVQYGLIRHVDPTDN